MAPEANGPWVPLRPLNSDQAAPETGALYANGGRPHSSIQGAARRNASPAIRAVPTVSQDGTQAQAPTCSDDSLPAPRVPPRTYVARAPPPRQDDPCKPCCALMGAVAAILFLKWLLSSAASDLPSSEHTEPVAFDYSDPVPVISPVAPVMPPPAPASGLPAECKIPGDEYAASNVCSPAVRNEWAKLAAEPRQQDTCRVDYDTGRMVCDTKVSCEGGTTHYIEDIRTTYAMEYDCLKCSDAQRGSCCRKCADLQRSVARGTLTINRTLINNVACLNCDARALSGLASKSEVSCSVNQKDGTFRCKQEEHCESGVRKVHTRNASFSCFVTPCSSCGDAVARAQCCATCLDNYCNARLGFADRKICQGCAMAASGY
eukprot:TRINITY_DN7411_c0_g1_i1.p1 TRINITY_DN7411_c0_g1~~TRINITY_DN7411_c0_g1_i1.p1  ORF type:complete len:375 (-),score=32.97 TRINITY_DN7411_c0_g1_i1:116-1240(-)